MAMDTHPCFLSGDVAFFFNEGSDAYLHMTADEHDVGSMWRERNHWHTFVLTPAGPPGVPLRGGDSVWLVGVTGKCVDVHADSEEATSQPRSRRPVSVRPAICCVERPRALCLNCDGRDLREVGHVDRRRTTRGRGCDDVSPL